MSRVGLVLGGGGITGAAYELAALMTIRVATGWDPNDADVIVGTSCGSFVGALVRNEALNLDSLVHPGDDREDVADRIRRHVYQKAPSAKIRNWVRYGIKPGLRRPGLTMFLGSPAPYTPSGIGDWVEYHIGVEACARWPARHTAIVAYDLAEGSRTAFGTEDAPLVGIADAVSASSAVPLVFRPHPIGDRLYVDGGVASGTHADLVLGHDEKLDLVLILAPMAAGENRRRAMFHEKMFDRVGLRSLQDEIHMIEEAWPDAEIVKLSPSPSVQNSMRPNPLDADRAVPTFMRTLISMKRTLARPAVWEKLSHFLGEGSKPRSRAR